MNANGALRTEFDGQTAADDVDALRAHEYALLARLLARAPDAAFLASLSHLRGNDTPLGQAHSAVAAAARAADPKALEREYFSIFTGVGRGELLPYASFYMTGFLNGRPLAAVRGDLAALGLERSAGLGDSEDHIAILFDVMAGLAAGSFEATTLGEAEFFARHIDPWASKFFDDLAVAPSSHFYRSVAALGSMFIAVEAEAFTIEE